MDHVHLCYLLGLELLLNPCFLSLLWDLSFQLRRLIRFVLLVLLHRLIPWCLSVRLDQCHRHRQYLCLQWLLLVRVFLLFRLFLSARLLLLHPFVLSARLFLLHRSFPLVRYIQLHRSFLSIQWHRLLLSLQMVL